MTVGAPPKATRSRDDEWLAFLSKPWVDKAIAIVAVIPFVWLSWIRFKTLGLDLPRIALFVQGVMFIGTMVVRKTPIRITSNPWYWLLTFVETYWIVLVLGVLKPGVPIAPHWVSGTIATVGAMLMIWARLNLGRSIGLVPALRGLVMNGPYRYVRHPIYSGGILVFAANMLGSYSPLNVTMLALGIFWFVLKTLAEESFLRSDPAYADYMKRVRFRWLPGIA